MEQSEGLLSNLNQQSEDVSGILNFLLLKSLNFEQQTQIANNEETGMMVHKDRQLLGILKSLNLAQMVSSQVASICLFDLYRSVYLIPEDKAESTAVVANKV